MHIYNIAYKNANNWNAPAKNCPNKAESESVE